MLHIRWRLGMCLILPLLSAPVHPSDLEASLDKHELTVEMDHDAVVYVTLRNKSAAPIYLTGIKVQLSEGASGNVYKPELLHERLRDLGPGQTWDGPLAIITPNHRGPLVLKGAIVLTGGSILDSSATVASIPLQMTINDPRRQRDGSYERGAVPVKTMA